MVKRPKRALKARLIIGLATMAFPLIATGAAQAAIAGATPASMTLHPVLISATVDNGANAGTIQACFDKTVTNIGLTSKFSLGGYRAGNSYTTFLSAKVDQSNTNCVDLIGSPGFDATDYTVLKVAAGAVASNSTTSTNYDDAVGLTNSASTPHDGTRGITTGPELVGILSPTGATLTNNALTFVFDKNLGTKTPVANSFYYYNSSGLECRAAAAAPVLQNGTTLTVFFTGATGPGCGTMPSTANAATGFVANSAVNQASDALSLNPDTSAVLPNSTPTSTPNLTGAALATGGQQIVYTFDKPVLLPAGTPRFYVALANGKEVQGTTATASGNTVTVNFPTQDLNVEFMVSASALQGAVTVVNGTVPSVPAATPVGGNAGASAVAFTTGPDVFGVTINRTSSTLVVNLDDRVVGPFVLPPHLYNALGTDVTVAPTNVAAPSLVPGPGPESITYTYTTSALSNVTSVGFDQGTFTQIGPFPSQNGAGPASGADQKNIAQLVGSINTAAIVRAAKHLAATHHGAKHHAKHHAKKHSKKH